MAEGEIDDLTMEQYLTLTRGNQAPGVVKPEIEGNVNFKIKSQFMRELRKDTFSRNKNEDAHEHVERVLYIVSLFNIPGVTHDTVMLRVFPITLTGAAKSTMNHQLLDSQVPIPGMTPAQALTAIQTIADHSQKWHDGPSSRSIDNNNSNTEGIVTIVSKLDSLGQDMKKLRKTFMLSKWDVKFAEDPISTRSVLRTKKLRALKRLNMVTSDVLHLSVMEQNIM
ncbi:hypothetical protein Tco_1370000 [Tanacetum coccineum]